jgi:hypothetical protein
MGEINHHLAWLAALLVVSVPVTTPAQVVDVTQETRVQSQGSAEAGRAGAPPVVGRRAAEKYMGPKSESSSGSVPPIGTRERYLAIHAAFFPADSAFKWGESDRSDGVGRFNAGVTYRIGEWVNTMDLALRFEYTSFRLAEGSASKLSVMFPVVMFPDANSRFPLFFGGALGFGIFGSQLSKESALSLDYSIFGGIRLFDVYQNLGFLIEGGIKNHVHVLSDGQFNGTYAAVGMAFAF